MPLTRYQIRSEFSLADPELYRTADKDDPEALLEGVAMAGLVGVLRQLGDLAEFAAEIFHDLHEDVMSTAARGHGLMARVQQLEAEFPFIEKAILSQTNHSSFFSTSAGADWHPNLQMKQNLLTHGDLPRFVMDSYEECRGPPRLFLLDKFDVAGAGACLKRYTDPSFFRVEAASSGISSVEVQREKKIRKVKKKGSRWRNGQTPDVLPASHAKLHELFLEERVENGHPDPARLVKLKRRPVNASSFDLKPGKSYMEKFLNPASPEQKIVCEVPANQSPLRLTDDNASESGLEIPDIKTVSPVENSLQSKDFTCLSPRKQVVVLKPSSVELNGEAKGIMSVPDPHSNGDMDESLSITHKMTIEEELGVHAHDITEESLDGDHSDDITSEIDNYMDALTTMDSEIETDNEYKNKNDQGFMNVRKHGEDNAANEEVRDVQANFSDSQSIENSSLSDGGNSSFKKGAFSFSGSDSISNLADNSPSDGEGTAKKFHSTKDYIAEATDLPSELPPLCSGTDSSELVELNDSSTDGGEIRDSEQASCSSSLKDLNPMPLPSAPAANSHEDPAPELDKAPYVGIVLSSKLTSDDTNWTNLADPSALMSDVPSLISRDTLFAVPSNNGPGNDSEHEDTSTYSVLHMSDMSVIVPEDKSGDNSVNEKFLTDSADENCTENLVEGKQSPHFAPEDEEDFSVALLPNSSDALRPYGLVSGVDAAAATTSFDSENLTSMVDTSEVAIMEERMKPETCGLAEDKGGDNVNEKFLMDSANENCTENLVEGKQSPHFAPEDEEDSSVILLPNSSDALRPDDLVSGVDAAAAAATTSVDSENLTSTVDTSEVATMEERRKPEICGLADGEEICGLTITVDLVGGGAASQDPEDHVNMDNLVTEFSLAGNGVASPAVVSPDGEAANDVFFPSSDKISSPFRTLTGVQETDEVVSPECLSEPLKQIEMKQLEDVPADIATTRPYEALSEDFSDIDATEPVGDPPLLEQTQNIYVHDITSKPSSEPRNQDLDLKPTHQSISEEAVDAATCSTHLPEAGISSEQSAKSKAEEFRIYDVHGNEATSELLNIKTLPASHLAEPAIPFGHSLESQSDQHTEGCVQEDEEHNEPFNLQSKQIETHTHIDQEPDLDTSYAKGLKDLPGQEHLVQSASQNPSATELVMNPFDSLFPTFGLQSEETHANMDAMPPLPPLPPMQWRIGKVQPYPPASQSEWIDHSQGATSAVKPCTIDEAQFDFASSNGVVGRDSSPFLSLAVTEVQRLEQSSTELENSSQPSSQSLGMVTTNIHVRNRSDCSLMEGAESLSLSSTLPETPSEEPAHGLVGVGGELTHSNSSASSPIPAIECMTAGCNPAPSQDTPTQPFHQLPPEAYSEVKGAELGAQNSGMEQGDSPDESVAQVSVVEEQRPQHDLSASQGETIWLPSTFGLPPNYGVGKLNGNKLPRPRNPLSDAVAAHDKSKLRKVAEQIRPQIGPKVEERDSLLEQIRAKSFNLKPPATTRPSIQGIQGPKTNLKVNAILEKANAIRQALAGSDEDDSDSWSDS